MWKETSEHPLTLARRFIERFGFNKITIEQFDMWVIDSHLAKDPETDDTKDARYREFTSARNKAKGMLNRQGPDCDDGDRFNVRVLIAGKLYETVPYSIAMLDNSKEFANQLSKFLTNKTNKLVTQERTISDLALMAGEDQPEMIEAATVLAAAREGKERVAREVRERVHQMNSWDTKIDSMINHLALKYEEKETKEG
jgi:hypothetical protein